MRRSLLLSLLASSALAAPSRAVIYLAVPTDDADRGIYRATERVLRDRGSVQNASVAYRETHAPFSPLTRGELDHAIPAWWPRALAADWNTGVAACKTHAVAPYGPGNEEAVRCGAKLAQALWQRWLDHEKPTLVVQIVMEAIHPGDELDDRQRLRVAAFRPGEPSQRTADRQEVYWEDVIEVASVLALRVATGGGALQPRVVHKALPAAAREAEAPLPELPPTPLPRRCEAAISEALVVDPPDARLSQVLVRHWAASARAARKKAPALRCTLDYQTRNEELVRRVVLLGSASLTCGKAQVVAKGQQPNALLLERELAPLLVQRLLEAHCAGALDPRR